MPNTTTRLKPIVGRAAFIDFPELNLRLVPAKTDSGAYRSAIHAKNVKIIERDGTEILTFELLKGHPCAGQSVKGETAEFSIVQVENSFGHREQRYEIKLLTLLDGKRFRTTFTLADRGKKIYPVLMGRRLLSRRFLVDTSITQVDRKILKRTFKIQLPRDEEEI